MARQTRQQRKARRQEQEAQSALASRAPARQPVRQPAEEAPPERAASRPPEAPGSSRRGSFVAESWAELQKVEWPGQKQVIQGTIVVLIACAIVGSYLWGADLVLKRLVQNVLLGQ